MKIFVLSDYDMKHGVGVHYGSYIPAGEHYDLLIAQRVKAGALPDQPIEKHFRYCILVDDHTYSVRIYEQQGPKKYAIHTENFNNLRSMKMGFSSFVYGAIMSLHSTSKDIADALQILGQWDDIQEVRNAARQGAEFGMQRPDK